MNFLAAIYWNVSPDIVHLGPFTIRWYGLLFALGFVIGYQIMAWVFKIEHKPQKDLEALTITMIISTVIGARLGHCLFYEPDIYLSNPMEILYIWKGGLASHGAAIGILIGLWLFVRKRKDRISFLWILDRIVLPVSLAGCFIRLGNFFNSEILGTASSSPWAVVFSRIDFIPRHPVQLYESISYLVIFFILFFIYYKYKSSISKGFTSGLFLTLIFGMRFILEYFKENQADYETILPIHVGQILSIPLVLVGLWLIYRSFKKDSTEKQTHNLKV